MEKDPERKRPVCLTILLIKSTYNLGIFYDIFSYIAIKVIDFTILITQ